MLKKFTFKRLYQLLLVFLIVLFGYPVGYFVLDSGKLNEDIKAPSALRKGETNVYLINLDRSIERYDYIKENINRLGLNVERISAVDGLTLSQQEISTKVDRESFGLFMGHYPSPGTIGCSLSHIKTWEAFLNSDFEFAVIVEDDVSFDPKLLRNVIDYLAKNSDLWDTATFEIYHRGFPLTIKKFMGSHRLSTYLMDVTHTGAYMINRSTAKKLLEKALPIKMPVDHYFTRSWEFDIKFIGIEPRLVHQTFGPSEIGKTKRMLNEKLSTIDSFKHMIYKLQSYVIRFFYNLKVYFTIKKTE